MNVLGIVAEYNPFHSGHGYQIRESRRMLGENAPVIAVMSGCWTQQADCAAADKWTRARLALMGGADLVLELPTVWATASAESFARGAVSILEATGLVTHLSFGSECGDSAALARAARYLDAPEYPAVLARFLDQGLSFPAARQAAVRELDREGTGAGALSSPNNNLGIEYIRALNALHSSISPMTVTRRGAGHNSLDTDAPTVSATLLRQLLARGRADEAAAYLPEGGLAVLTGGAGTADLARIERAMLARIRTMTPGDWSRLPDSGSAEGLPQRLAAAGKQAASMEEFFTLAKTKRYTHARLRRLALWAYLGISAADIPAAPPYIRVLGFNARGQQLLKAMKKSASLPVLTKPAHARRLDGDGQRLFALEARCTDLYDLCLEQIPAPGRDWTAGPVMRTEEG